MRVKLLIAMALASIFLLVSVIPAGAVSGVTGLSSVLVQVPTIAQVPITGPAAVVPCVSFNAPASPLANTGIANTITLGGPAIQATISLAGPQTPSMVAPSFVLQQLTPPSITGFKFTAPIFDP
jgi:hypothetical protein